MNHNINQNSNVVSYILNNILEDKNNPTALINCIDMALSLGRNNINYTISSFHYLLKLNENIENYPIYRNQVKLYKNHIKFRMFENFLSAHLIKKSLLPSDFKELIDYFKDEILGNKVEDYYQSENNELHTYGTFIRSTLLQDKDMFDFMHNIIKEVKIPFKTDKFFFETIENIIKDYVESQENENLAIVTHHVFDHAPSLKIKLGEEQRNLIKKKRLINDKPEETLIEFLKTMVDINEEYIKKQPLYYKYKKESNIYLDSTLKICQEKFSQTLFLKTLDIFKVDLLKAYTRQSVFLDFSSRKKYLSFVAICANSSEYNIDLIDRSGNWWLQNIIETPVEKDYFFKQYNEDFSKVFLNKLYNDYIKSPFKDDMRIILFPHLDLTCIERGLEKQNSIKESLFDVLGDNLLNGQKVFMFNFPEFKYLSHLVCALNENPIVVFHALRLQEIGRLLEVNKKMDLEEVLSISKEKSLATIFQLEIFFRNNKSILESREFNIYLDNDNSVASFDKNEKQSLPRDFPHFKNLLKIDKDYIDHVERNFSLFRLNHIIENKKDSDKVKKRKI